MPLPITKQNHEKPPRQVISQLNLERHWLQLAYQQSRANALAHCARNGRQLLPPASFETLASLWIAEYERNIAEYEGVPAQLDAWQKRTSAPDSIMEILYERSHADKAWDTRLHEGRIEEITRNLAGSDGDEARLNLWNELEFPDPPRSKDFERLFY